MGMYIVWVGEVGDISYGMRYNWTASWELEYGNEEMFLRMSSNLN